MCIRGPFIAVNKTKSRDVLLRWHMSGPTVFIRELVVVLGLSVPGKDSVLYSSRLQEWNNGRFFVLHERVYVFGCKRCTFSVHACVLIYNARKHP